MTTPEKIAALISDIRYQVNGVATGPCAKKACKAQSRGGGRCAECLTAVLATLVAADLAQMFLDSTRAAARAATKMEAM